MVSISGLHIDYVSVLIFLICCLMGVWFLQVTEKFVNTNGLQFICRAHQLVHEGYKSMFDGKLITVWSAPNYCYRCGNVAAILAITKPDEFSFKTFSAVPDEERVVPPSRITPYFL